MRGIISLFVGAGSAIVLTTSLSGQTTSEKAAASTTVAAGAAAYKANCASCHGADLSGGAGPALIAPDIADNDVGSLAAQIKQTMPLGAPGSLSDTQYNEIASYVISKNTSK